MNESTKHRMDQLFLSLKDRERWLVGIESAAYLAVILTALGKYCVNLSHLQNKDTPK